MKNGVKKKQASKVKEIRKKHILQEKEKKKNQIMKSAIELVSKKGFHKTSIEDITFKAKVATGTFYNFFEKKEDVVVQYFYDGLEKCQNDIFDELESKNKFSDQFDIILSAYWKYIFRNKELAKIFITERIMTWGTKYNSTESLFTKTMILLIKKAIKDKKIKINIDPERVGKIIFALNTVYMISWVNGTRKSKKECLRQMKLDMNCIYNGVLFDAD